MTRANQNTLLRTPETWERYQNAPKHPECFMCEEPALDTVVEFDNWLIVQNEFPYDAVATRHHMLIPVRHFQFIENATPDEYDELYQIKEDIEKWDWYDCIMENFTVAQSVPAHLHYHLLKWKRT